MPETESEGAGSGLRAFVAEVTRTAGGRKAVAATLTQAGFRARGRDYSASAVGAWERGEAEPNARLVFHLAVRYGVSLDRFALGDPLQVTLEDQIKQGEQRMQDELQSAERELRRRLARIENALRVLATTDPRLHRLLQGVPASDDRDAAVGAGLAGGRHPV